MLCEAAKKAGALKLGGRDNNTMEIVQCKWIKVECSRSRERGIPNLREGLAKVTIEGVVEGRRAA